METLHAAGFAIGLRFTRLGLRLAGFRRTITFLGRLPRPFERRPATREDTVRWAGTIWRVGGRPYGGTCLDRSVLLWFLMRQRHLDGQLRIGVSFDDDRLDGHAWVELDGVVVNDDPDVADRFAVFDDDPTGIVFA